MPSFKDIKNLANNPLVGVVTTAMRPTPAGIAYTGANLASKAMTGKTIPEHLKDTVKGPAQSKSNKVGPNKKGKQVGMDYDAKQKNILKDRKAKGGLVTYKNISQLQEKIK